MTPPAGHYVVPAAVPPLAYPVPPAFIRSIPDTASGCSALTYVPSKPALTLRRETSWALNGITADHVFNNINVVPQRCVRFGPYHCG